MLTRLRLRDFKSFADQAVSLGPTTLLVGANGSGKSNFLDAIRFLQGLALGYEIPQALTGYSEGGREVWSGIRGGFSEVVRGGTTGFQIDSSWRLATDESHHHVSFHMRADRVSYSAHADGTPASPFRQSLHVTTLMELKPGLMRAHVSNVVEDIGSSGENLSAAVWHLAQDPERKQDLIDWLSALCSPTIVDIEFDVTSLLSEVLLVLVEADGTKVSARVLSDGTLRFLGTIVALLAMKDGDTLVVEELETGLHPSRVHLLIELVEAVTKGGRCQVIATTHSPQALMALSPQGLHDAIIFGRVPDHPGTIMRRLGDLPNFDQVAARTGIDQMFTSEWLEHSL